MPLLSPTTSAEPPERGIERIAPNIIRRAAVCPPRRRGSGLDRVKSEQQMSLFM
jgi:hypothetical protein